MRAIISQEFKKFFITRRNWFVLSIITLFLFLFVTSSAQLNLQVSQSLDDNILMEIQSIKESLVKLELDYKSMPDNNTLKNLIQTKKNEVNLLYDMQYSLFKEDWGKYLDNKIEKDSLFLESIENGTSVTSYPLQDLKDEIAINKILLEEGITPIDTVYSMQGYNFIVVFMGLNMILVLLVLIVFFTSSILSSEFEKGTYKILFTQPIGKVKIVLSKLIAALFINYLWVSILIGTSFMILSCIYGMGDGNYPTKFYVNGVVTFIPVTRFVVYCMVALFLLITFTVVLVITISIFVKNSNVTLALTALILGGSTLLLNQVGLSNLTYLNPGTYADISNVLKGVTATLYHNPQIEMKQLFFVFPWAIIGLAGISMIQSRRMRIGD